MTTALLHSVPYSSTPAVAIGTFRGAESACLGIQTGVGSVDRNSTGLAIWQMKYNGAVDEFRKLNSRPPRRLGQQFRRGGQTCSDGRRTCQPPSISHCGSV